jgi:hypothetical protein
MSLILHCDCGHQLTLTDDEMAELTWCPRCRKVLVRPRLYRGAERSFARPRPSPSPPAGGISSPMPLQVVGWLILAAVFLGLIIAALDQRNPQEPSSSPPSFRPEPRRWDQHQPPQPILGDPPPRPFDFDRGLLPDPPGRPKLEDPLAPFRPGMENVPGVRPGGPERLPDDH